MTSTDTATELWDTVRSILRDSLPGETYEMWFSKIEPTKVEDDFVELLAPNVLPGKAVVQIDKAVVVVVEETVTSVAKKTRSKK